MKIFKTLLLMAFYLGILIALFHKAQKDIGIAYLNGCLTGADIGELPETLDGEAATSYVGDYCQQETDRFMRYNR